MKSTLKRIGAPLVLAALLQLLLPGLVDRLTGVEHTHYWCPEHDRIEHGHLGQESRPPAPQSVAPSGPEEKEHVACALALSLPALAPAQVAPAKISTTDIGPSAPVQIFLLASAVITFAPKTSPPALYC